MKNLLLLLIITAFLSACSNSSSIEKEEKTIENAALITVSVEQFKTNEMTLIQPVKVPFSEMLTANGYIDVPPEFKASISTYYAGYVKKITLIEGNFVKKGQLLFQLENPEYLQMQQEYLESKEQLEYLKNEYERQKALAEEQIAAQKEYLKAKSNYLVTKTICDGSAKKLALLGISVASLTSENIRSVVNIYAPISGYVSEIHVTQGKVLNPDEVAMTITNTEHLHAELQVFEKDIDGIKIGQKIVYTIGNQKFGGDVHLISRQVSNEKRTVSVHGHLDEGGHLSNLYPGMYVQAQIAKSSANKLAIPESAVVELDNAFYILVKQNADDKNINFKKLILTNPVFSNEYVAAPEIREDMNILDEGAFDVLIE